VNSTLTLGQIEISLGRQFLSNIGIDRL